MEIEVSVDGMDLAGSRVLHLSQPNFSMKFGAAPVNVRFISDGGKNRWEVGPDDDGKSLAIRFFNFKSRVGVGRLKPIFLGATDDYELWLTFHIETISVENDERVVSLNVFKRDKIND